MYEDDVYKTTVYVIKLQQWYCPNCAALLRGYEDKDGKTRIKCPRCGTWMTKYKANRQYDIIEMRIPESCLSTR